MISAYKGWSPEWPVTFTLYFGTFALFTLELQQMVEVCSRPPAIGECVYRGLVLRCPSPPQWCMVSGPRHSRHIPQQSLFSLTWSLIWLRLHTERLCQEQAEHVLALARIVLTRSRPIRNDLKEARWLCRSIWTVDCHAVSVSIFRLHPLPFRTHKIESGLVCPVIVFSRFFFFPINIFIFLSGCLHCVKCCHQGCYWWTTQTLRHRWNILSFFLSSLPVNCNCQWINIGTTCC